MALEIRKGSVKAFGIAGIALLGSFAVAWSFLTVPQTNMEDGPVEALLVLGSPANFNGALTQTQQWRVREALQEYQATRAPRVLFSGGPAANRFVESEVMAAYAMHQGLPQAAIFQENTSTTTLENLQRSERILNAHGWRRVEVISSPEHLPRVAVLLQHTGLLWRVHAAPTPGRGNLEKAGAYAEEAIGTALIRCFGIRAEPMLHDLAKVPRAIAFWLRWIFYKLQSQVHKSVGKY